MTFILIDEESVLLVRIVQVLEVPRVASKVAFESAKICPQIPERACPFVTKAA